ncbi:conserved hypothetical protein [Leishmania major strain Friedlin]|uniref:Kinesin n=1 Tax=Leishmania major TaxID=5664 RepID=Q4QA71_LEIMA|nr:conserved hypothetical protein [Leishmania major strain Friedlin]CAG9575033.1 hypothetical_protein_-_conserved [Leishmania major strain Friedlin]CAJ04532.1 conserved hypothetical protein [Leishmania major strain Friedlin]|eukprot:XP_001683777.1 conserved hypothetical protein [Leishmania major strain Friedlin]
MLVCVREFDKSELSARHGKSLTTHHFERYYTLYRTETSFTIVDVVDNRARKTVNYDVFTNSSTQLYDQVVEPLLATVLTPNRASQAVVVVDGQSGNRRHTLLDPVEGILARTARAAVAHPGVTSVSVSAVTLEDNNTLTDIMPDRNSDAAREQPTILEDTCEQFTSVEDAHYLVLDSEVTWEGVLHRMTAAFAELKHQVISFIFAFHESTGLPNTTMQFVSFTVNEVARGLKSSRHAVSSAAALVECRSPTLTFTATKLLYLLKPTLLGQQPGAWVASFSPVSLLEAAEHETFQEAFAVAQTAARLYSSRIALLNGSLPPANGGRVAPTAGVGLDMERAGESAPLPAVEDGGADMTGAASRLRPGEKSPPSFRTWSRGTSTNPQPGDPGRSPAFQHDLVDTPAAAQDRATESVSGHAVASAAAPSSDDSRDVGENCAAQTDPDVYAAPAPVESIQRGASEERSAARYELDTYRVVMERAMSKLRAEMREYAGALRDTRKDVRWQQKKSRELESELEAMRSSYDAAVSENNRLREALRAGNIASDSAQLAALQSGASASAAQRSRQEPAAKQAPANQPGDDHAARFWRSDLAILEARVEELTELVAFHQREIQAHVANEHRYRQRILDLEAELREKERDAIADKAAVKEARRAADVARAAAETPPALSRAVHTSSSTEQEDRRFVEERATEVEYRLREALDALQRERTQRLRLEHLMKRREEEEVLHAAPPGDNDLLRSMQCTYEMQLRELRSDMSDLRAELLRHLTKPSVPQNLGDASSYGATPVGRQGRDDPAVVNPQRPTPPRMSPIPDASLTHFSHAGDDVSAHSSRGGDAAPSPLQQPRQRSAQSFEQFMQEEPRYKLHCASFLRRRPRTPAT